jgi:hypothetical protein
MAKGGLTAPVLAGFASGFILILSIILISAATPERDVSIYDAIHQDLLKGIAIGKATIEVRSVPEFGMTTGSPICRNQLSDQQVASSMLGAILANASNGERKTYRLSPDEFIPIAKTLCVTKAWIEENKNLPVPFYPGWISVQSDNGMKKYWYGINIYWNATEKTRYKPVGPDYNGPMPIYDKVKVYIFASNPDFYDENLLSDIQRAIDFKPVTLEPFGAIPHGIIHRYNFTLVVPNGTEIYIDKDLKKPDGSPLSIKDLHPDSDFGDSFSQGSIPVLYDYEYVQVPAIWFTVDAPEGAKVVDSHVDAIKHVIDAKMSKCVKFKQEHAGWEGRPCPN